MVVSDSAIEGISGALGGIIALTSTYPLMTIATLQAVRQKKQATAGTSATKDAASHSSTQSKLQDFVQLCKESGWRGLYAGIEPALLGTAVSQGIYFYLYSSFRQLAVAAKSKGRPVEASRRQDIGVVASLVTAALAGCGNVLLTNPIWVVATRMQAARKAVEQQQHGGGEGEVPVRPVAVAREIYTDYGVVGFWKGVVPSLVMVANPTVQYMLYEAMMSRRNAAQRGALRKKPSAWEIFGISAVAKLGATLITYPLLLVKTRMQTVRKGSGTETQYGSTLDAVAHVYKTEGLLGFYRGMHTKMVQSVLAAALLFLIKEEVTEATASVLRGGNNTPKRAVV